MTGSKKALFSNLSKFERLRLMLVLIVVLFFGFYIARTVLLSPDLIGGLFEYVAPHGADRNIKIVSDLNYVIPANSQQAGDLYLPKTSSHLTPAVILVHGGTWKDGSRNDEKENALYFAKHGFAAFTIDYRLVGHGGEFPNDIDDVKSAFRFLETNAEKYSINPKNISICGSSSGAHMAMLAAYTFPAAQIQANSRFRVHRPAACVSLFGLSDLEGDFAHSSDKSFVVRYLNGKTPQSDPAIYKEASPITHARAGVPTIFVHGTDDHNVPIAQSLTMAAALQKFHLATEVVPVEGAGHGFGPVTRELVLARVITFLGNKLPQNVSR